MLADALAGWSTGPARLAAAAAWSLWAAGLFACLAPRPWGTTLLRVVAPTGVVVAFASVPATGTAAAVIGVIGMLAAAVCALSGAVVTAAANALAYGEEVRFPLRVPTPLLFAPVPLAVAFVAAGALTGPLLLADGNYVVGALCTVVGFPLAYALIRSLHALAGRWLVVVPAGVTIVDPLTLIDPVLVERNAITRVRVAETRATGADALDLRLGSLIGGVELVLGRDVLFGRRRGRIDGEMVEPAAVDIAIVGRSRFMALAVQRRIATG